MSPMSVPPAPSPILVYVEPGPSPIYYHDSHHGRLVVTEPGFLIDTGEPTAFNGFISIATLAQLLEQRGWKCISPHHRIRQHRETVDDKTIRIQDDPSSKNQGSG